jgi:DNA-binding XRE family transcriptional regulator
MIIFMTPEDLKKWRMEHGYTQVTLAQALESHSMTISQWERGIREIPKFLHLALDALECKNKEVKRGKGTKKMKKERDENGKHLSKR